MLGFCRVIGGCCCCCCCVRRNCTLIHHRRCILRLPLPCRNSERTQTQRQNSSAYRNSADVLSYFKFHNFASHFFQLPWSEFRSGVNELNSPLNTIRCPAQFARCHRLLSLRPLIKPMSADFVSLSAPESTFVCKRCVPCKKVRAILSPYDPTPTSSYLELIHSKRLANSSTSETKWQSSCYIQPRELRPHTRITLRGRK